ncbi:hypothetical protein FRC02_006714 [Tulasnella sp. 418]|nr:hypothetical protein FRC02_006714 [Tulasnella sp. 418]
MIVSGSSDKTVCIWDAVTGSLIRKLEGHSSYVHSVAFSHDSTMIVSGSSDKTVCIWDAVTGSLIRKLEGHISYVHSVAFSHDSTMIVSGSSDKTVCIWDAVTGSLIRNLKGHNDHVKSVAFSADGSHVVAYNHEGLNYMWSIADPSKPPVRAPQIFSGHQAMTSNYILKIQSGQIICKTSNGQETLLCYLPELGSYISCVMQSGAKLTFGTEKGDIYILDSAPLINTYFT